MNIIHTGLKGLLLFLMIVGLIGPSLGHAEDLEGLTLRELEAVRAEADARIRLLQLPDAAGYLRPESWEGYRREPGKHKGTQLRIEGDLFWAAEDGGGFLYQLSLREEPLLLPGDGVEAFGIYEGLHPAPGGSAGEIGLPLLHATLCVRQWPEGRPPAAAPYAGTRDDPARLNAPARADASGWSGHAGLEIEMLQCWRGDAAYKRAQNMSVYNVKPRRAQEYIIIEMRVKALSAPRGRAQITQEDFFFVSAQGAEYPHHFLINNPQPLRPRYEGSEQAALIACMIDKGDRPLVVYLPESERPLWFDPNL